MERLLVCDCGEVVIRANNGTTKISNKVVILKGGNGYVICKGCSKEHSVPLSLNEPELLRKSRIPRLYIRDK